MACRLVQLEVYHVRLPFRKKMAGKGDGVETIIVGALLADGTVGYGEARPLEHITGETMRSVQYNLSDILAGYLSEVNPETFAELLELVDGLPFENEQGQLIHAARCGVELALLDAYSRYFRRSLSTIGGWLGFGSFSQGGSIDDIRITGVLGQGEPEEVQRVLRKFWRGGIRDYKLVMGYDFDGDVLDVVEHFLAKSIQHEKATLRVDGCGAWDIDRAIEMCQKLADMEVLCVEQPLSAGDSGHLHTLASLSPVALMADESLLGMDDGIYLAEHDFVDFFNIQIGKNGGLIPALRLAGLAYQYSLDYQLGAVEGESGLLGAAGCWFLQVVPNVRFTEILRTGRRLDKDIISQRLEVGRRGRLPSLKGYGLGVQVDPRRLAKLSVAESRKIHLA